MTKDKALKLALEALESGVDTQIGRVAWTEYDCELMEQAITAIKEALAPTSTQCEVQPEQEPVGVFREDDDIGHVELDPHRQMALKDSDNLYTAPPKREWVGLTNNEIEDCMEMSIQKTCRAIEAKLKEKNT